MSVATPATWWRPRSAKSTCAWRPGGLEAHDRLAAPHTVGPGELFEYRDLARVAQLADLIEERFDRQLGEVGEPGDEVLLVRLELRRRPCLRGALRGSVAPKRRPHGVSRQAGLPGDRFDREPLLVKRDDVHPLPQTYQLTPHGRIGCFRERAPAVQGGQFQIVTRG